LFYVLLSNFNSLPCLCRFQEQLSSLIHQTKQSSLLLLSTKRKVLLKLKQV